MKTVIRIFNDAGINEFRNYLNSINSDESRVIPSNSFLTDDSFSTPAIGIVEVERYKFDSKRKMIIYIAERVQQLQETNILYNRGLWTWLSAFFFDSVCPLVKGVRKPGSEVRHILSSNEWNRYYRHLLAAPVRFFIELAEKSDIYLTGDPDKHGDLFEQLASRNEYATSIGIVEAATLLYWDREKNKIKKGARNKDTHPGVLRRLTGAILPQFMLTYDVNGMSGEEIIALLPPEFNSWKRSRVL
jgi:hypothetical protein